VAEEDAKVNKRGDKVRGVKVGEGDKVRGDNRVDDEDKLTWISRNRYYNANDDNN
jgi:hypothetical protein